MSNLVLKRIPRRARRGLGLFDTLLAVAVLSFMVLIGSQLSSTWVERKVMAAEARAVSDLARAGRLWLEGDITNRQPVTGETRDVLFSTLEAAGLWSPTQLDTTPFRHREMDLTLIDTGAGQIMVAARAFEPDYDACQTATGTASTIPRTLVAEEDGVSGVGVVAEINGALTIIGPDVLVDVENAFAADSGLLCGDLVALAHVYTGVACSAYLHRIPVPGCPDANRMATNLDLGGHELTGAGILMVDEVSVGRLTGNPTIQGGLTVLGDMSVSGRAEIETLVARGATDISGTLSVGGDVDVAGAFNAVGSVSAGDLEFDGDVMVSGTLRAREMDANQGSFRVLEADEFTASHGRFRNRLVVIDLFVQNHNSGADAGGRAGGQ